MLLPIINHLIAHASSLIDNHPALPLILAVAILMYTIAQMFKTHTTLNTRINY